MRSPHSEPPRAARASHLPFTAQSSEPIPRGLTDAGVRGRDLPDAPVGEPSPDVPRTGEAFDRSAPLVGWFTGALVGACEAMYALAQVRRTPALVGGAVGLSMAVCGLLAMFLSVAWALVLRALACARGRGPSARARVLSAVIAALALAPAARAALSWLAPRRHGPLGALGLGLCAAGLCTLAWALAQVLSAVRAPRTRGGDVPPPASAVASASGLAFALALAVGAMLRWPLDPSVRGGLLGALCALCVVAPWLVARSHAWLARRSLLARRTLAVAGTSLFALACARAIRGVEAMIPWGLAPWLLAPWIAAAGWSRWSRAVPSSTALPGRSAVTWLSLAVVSVAVVLSSSRDESVRKLVASRAAGTSLALGVVRAALDRDRDGHPRWIAGGDCRDDDPEVHPGAADWPGDGIDADCDGRDDTVELPRARPFIAIPAGVPARPNVLLLTVDALRADHLGAYGYARATSPAIDALARESLRFDRAFSNAPSTRLSMPTIATGRWPSTIAWDNSIWWPRFTARQRTLAEALHDHGYETGAVYSIEYFSRRYARGFERGIDVYDDRWTSLHTELHGAQESSGTSSREVADSAIEFVSRRREHPWFLWAHFFDPHHQYLPHRDGETPRFGDAPMDLYDEEIAYTDRHIGRLLARLRETGQWERTVIVLTGDHGEGFGEHGVSTHGFHLYAAQTRVPMIVRVPGVAPGRSGVPVSHVDVAPTLANLAGAREEPTFLGRSMVDTLARTRATDDGRVLQEVTYDGAIRRWAIVSAAHHLLWNHTPESTRECYDLRLDPDEREDLMGSLAGDAPCDALFEELSRTAASLSLTPEYARTLASGVLAPGVPRPAPEHGTDAQLGTLVRVAGWDGPTVVNRGQRVTVTVHFDALDRVTGGWDLFVHLSGRVMARNLDHPVLDGVYPVDRWQPGQRLRDRWTFTVAPDLLPGTYDLLLGLYRGSERLPVIPTEAGDDQRRLRVGRIEVR
jgi:arylsulfatase A-like enzyme